jgi:hypothetical protein
LRLKSAADRHGARRDERKSVMTEVWARLRSCLPRLACFGTGWPDVIFATVMTALVLHGAITVIREAASELRYSGFAPFLSEGIKPS